MLTPMESSSSFFSLKKNFFLPYFFVLLVMALFVSFYALVFSTSSLTSFAYSWLPPRKNEDRVVPFAIGRSEEGCDLFSGQWIRDNKSEPLYEEFECPYLPHSGQACLLQGRPDTDYIYWKWQPNGCFLPSFNASLMLEALRGKKMMFVGDSISRGFFYSMICLLQKFIADNAKSSIGNADQRIIFTAKEYNATVEFYWAPLLFESNSDDPESHRLKERIIRRDSMDVHGQHWKGVDILVIHTFFWWFPIAGYIKILPGSFQDKVKNSIDMPPDDAYRMALESMLKWIEENIDTTKTRVFFSAISLTHGSKAVWGDARKGNCNNETTPVEDPNYNVPIAFEKAMQVIEELLNKPNGKITLLNITRLTNYRKDAHISIYQKKWGKMTAKQLASPMRNADCIHWCLPGVPDTWSQLLFTKLFYP